MQPEPDQVATSLGLDSSTIRWLDARGLLPRLELTEQQGRTRLYQAHLAFLLRQSDGASFLSRESDPHLQPAPQSAFD